MNFANFVIFKRELKAYFETPVAFVFMTIYLFLSAILTFYVGNFYEMGHADLEAFFSWQPWLYLFLMPAISMRLWAEEKRSGTFELLMTLPIKPYYLVIIKHLAALSFAIICLIFTFPIWLTVNYLGEPDNGVIIASYFACILLAACFLSLGECVSVFTKNQVIAYVVSITICFLFMVSGFPLVINFFISLGLPQFIIDTISSFSLTAAFEDMSRGVINLQHIFYVVTLTISAYIINIAAILYRRR